MHPLLPFDNKNVVQRYNFTQFQNNFEPFFVLNNIFVQLQNNFKSLFTLNNIFIVTIC
jgi:hypothetical protein